MTKTGKKELWPTSHLKLQSDPPPRTLGEVSSGPRKSQPPPGKERTTEEMSAPLHGSTMASVCASLLPPHASALPALFLPNFYKHTVMLGLTSQILEISEWVWHTWFMGSMKAWLPG